MLVLSRKIGERILIGSGIEVVVVSASGNRVRLGVTAPSEIPVHREEVARRLKAELRSGHVSGTKTADARIPTPLPSGCLTYAAGRFVLPDAMD